MFQLSHVPIGHSDFCAATGATSSDTRISRLSGRTAYYEGSQGPGLSSVGTPCGGHAPRSQESGVRSQESGVRSQESGVRSQESGVRSQESGVRSQESGVRSQESGVRSQESGVRSQESGVRMRLDRKLQAFSLESSFKAFLNSATPATPATPDSCLLPPYSFTSSVITLKCSKRFCPNAIVMGTSPASRPRPINTRPVRRRL